MCGLSAIISLAGVGALARSLADMHGRIAHRGPDGEGFVLVDAEWRATWLPDSAASCGVNIAGHRAGLAFRWLHIQDPGEAARQPMSSPDGAVWLMLNGEIYNFPDLRTELEALGHRFVSESDTEVVLAAYRQWGSGCFSRLNGMWALIILDLRERKMIVSRDRFGIKPLFYHRDADRLMFASEIKQLLAAGAPPLANREALARFVRGGRPATPQQTFFAGIHSQPAASYAEIDLEAASGQIDFRPYWRLDPAPESASERPFAAARNELEQLLTRSVSEHMLAQVPRGNLISGGLDSSLLAALSAPEYARRGKSAMSASMVMTAAPSRYDKSPYIDQVVSALRFRSFRADLSAPWLKANIDRITWAQEEPVSGVAVAGQFLVYEVAARHGARVVLDGQGADEIFGGYPRHQYTLLRDFVQRRAFGALVREVAALLRRDLKFALDVWQLRLLPRLRRLFGRHRSSRPAVDFIRPAALDGIRSEEVRPTCRSTALTCELLSDVLTGNLRPALAVTDRNSMAHSIEARVPYVDRRIVEFAFQLPDRHKVGAGQRKRILRRVAERYLPRAVANRVDRIGFGAPVQEWLTTDFRAELEALPNSETFTRSQLIDASRLQAYIAAYLAGAHMDAGTVWRLYAIDRWARVYGVTCL